MPSHGPLGPQCGILAWLVSPSKTSLGFSLNHPILASTYAAISDLPLRPLKSVFCPMARLNLHSPHGFDITSLEHKLYELLNPN